jgi:sulfate permease, SulP family
MGGVVGPLPADAIVALNPMELWTTTRTVPASLLLEAVLPAAILLAAVSAIEGLLSAVVADSVTRGRHEGNRALASQGVANLAAGLFGALPAAGYMNTPIASFRAGARTPLSTLFHALFVLLVLLALSPFVAKVPLAALAGLMIYFAVTMIDRWSRDLLWRVGGGKHGRTEMVLNVGIVVGVAAAQLTLNVLVALVIGVLASAALLLVKLSRSPVRRHLDGTLRSSLRVRSAEAREALRTVATRIRILELEGELFFGTADRLQREVDALPADTRWVIIDLRRVNEIDATGARVLDVLSQRCDLRQMRVALSHVGPGDRRGDYLRALGLEQAIAPRRWFSDLDRALEWAEDELLAGLRVAEANDEVPPARMAILRDLDADDLAKVTAVLERHELRSGDSVFREGEEGERMYFIARGQVSIGVGVEGEGRDVRLATFSAGVVFGEMALIQGERRSADARASVDDVVLLSLSRAALEQLARTDPELGMRIYRNIARELAARLRATTRALRVLD